MPPHGFQIVAARGLLRWTQADLAERSKVAGSTIKRLEVMPGELSGHPSTISAITGALEAAGVVFLNEGASAEGGPGVRLAGKNG